ncbi:MAG TPA: ABC transporter permease subunit [Vicinamibacteria bacterium]|nr:ABC transporter permease subunit [Vicinamibacteria bacterium]
MKAPASPLSFLKGASGVFDLALEQATWSRRAIFMAILLGLPAVLALLFRTESLIHVPPEVTGFELFGNLVVFYYLGNALPLTALFYAGSLVADEVEGKTITYLLSRPISRTSILAGKFAAFMATGLSFTLPPLLVAFLLLVGGDRGKGLAAAAPDLFLDMGVCALALAAYGAVFTLLGCVLKRPMIPGLLYIFVWELVASHLPGYMPRLTLAAHLRSLVRHRPAEEGLLQLFGQVIPAAQCLAALAALTLTALLVSAWIFSRREYVVNS